tara:strand:- start:311 stop:667 length:357 start_codon:yes stop_codon:yes gene_type:complete
MAISYELRITDRVQTNKAVLADGEEAVDYIEAVVCVLTATDTDSGHTARTDPWVSLSDPATVDRADFVEFADMDAMPGKIKDQLETWGNDAELRQQLANQIDAQKTASVEKLSPWANV